MAEAFHLLKEQRRVCCASGGPRWIVELDNKLASMCADEIVAELGIVLSWLRHAGDLMPTNSLYRLYRSGLKWMQMMAVAPGELHRGSTDYQRIGQLAAALTHRQSDRFVSRDS